MDTNSGLVVFCWVSGAKPGEVIEMGSELPCPATKPTARSLDPAGVTDPEAAVALSPADPFDPSRGPEVATPEYSCRLSATVVAPVVTVTLLTDAASEAYHISPSESWPETAVARILIHLFFPSLTDVIGWLVPVHSPAFNTRRSPALVGAGRVTVLVEEPAL
jgi:hypothetical protein